MLDPHDLKTMDATEMGRRLATRQLRSEDLAAAHLALIEERNPPINAFALVRPEATLDRARQMDHELDNGVRRSAFHGVPFTVKDSLDTAGWRTARGSRIFEDRVPDADATAVARMLDAGAVLLAKTNVPEFSFWTETDNDLAGRTNHPDDESRTAGGSSGGESAAIASRMSPAGLGSDVAISVRGPAHCTGIAALKPSRSRIPITGHWPPVPAKFWHVGPMARTVRDVAAMFDILHGRDGIDENVTEQRLARTPTVDTSKLKVGWTSQPAFGPVSRQVDRVLENAATAVTDHVAVVEHTKQLDSLAELDGTRISAILFIAEVVPLFSKYRGQAHLLTDRVRRMLDLDIASTTEQQDALDSIDLIERILDRYFGDFDILLCPVCPTTAPPHNRSHLQIDEESVPARAVMRATVPFNLTGHPAVSLPFGTADDGLPINVQIVSRPKHDEVALSFAAALESRRPTSTTSANRGLDYDVTPIRSRSVGRRSRMRMPRRLRLGGSSTRPP